MQVSVNVCVFVFDILMVDGDVLLKSTMRDRRARVAQALPNMKPGFIQLAQSIQLTSPDSLEANVVNFASILTTSLVLSICPKSCFSIFLDLPLLTEQDIPFNQEKAIL